MSMICIVYAVSSTDLDRLHSETDFFDELTDYENQDATSCSLEKAWHGLHYLLTGDAWDAAVPLGFLLAGREIEGADSGYGPARTFTPDESRAVHAALSTVTDEELWSRFDADAMTSQGIYPEIWDEPEAELRDEYTASFREVKRLIADAVSSDSGLLIMLG